MSKIPTYYNDFKKNEEGEPEEMLNLKQLFIGILGLASATQGAMTQQPRVNIEKFQVARQQIMDAKILGGNELVAAKDYIGALEKTLAEFKKGEAEANKKEAELAEKARLEAQEALDAAEANKKWVNEKIDDAAGFGLGYLLASIFSGD